MDQVDSTQLLPMALVLSGNGVSPCKEVLYADYIDSDSVVSAFNSLVDLGPGGICEQTSKLISNNKGLMSKTNSDRFYKGEQAQRQFENMDTIGFRFDQITSYINDSGDIDLIKEKVKQYNTELTKVKNNCRKKMLQTAADAYNAEKNEWPGYPKTKEIKDEFEGGVEGTIAYSGELGLENNITHYDYECTGMRTVTNEYTEGTLTKVGYVNYYTYTIHKYKQIKYWNFFKNWDPFHLDPDVLELEDLFRQVGATIPYDPGLVVEFDVD